MGRDRHPQNEATSGGRGQKMLNTNQAALKELVELKGGAGDAAWGT
jgi:hypothetical protein